MQYSSTHIDRRRIDSATNIRNIRPSADRNQVQCGGALICRLDIDGKHLPATKGDCQRHAVLRSATHRQG